MKNSLRCFSCIAVVLILIASSYLTSFAHSGRTDSRGGHKDNKNKSGLGSYHYHCGGYPAHLHTDGYCPYRDVFPRSVKITSDKKVLRKGESIRISAIVSPSNSCDTDVYWESSNPGVVSVRDGEITAVDYGTATVTATTFNGKAGTIKLTVKEVTAESVELSEYNVNMYIGEEQTVAYKIIPEDVDNPDITWESSDSSIAQVTQQGVIYAKSEGEVRISATSSNGKVGYFYLTVQEKYVDSVEITSGNLELYLNETKQLFAQVLPVDATHPDVTWESSDSNVIKMGEGGMIEAVGCGTATVTAISSNGLSNSIMVTVSEIVAERIEIVSDGALFIGDTSSLSVVFFPSNTTIRDISWSSSNEDIVSVNDNGTLFANGLGTATITATQKDTNASILIEVLPIDVKVVEITALLPEQIEPGIEIQFSALVKPDNATFPDVSWSSSNEFVAEINNDGIVKTKMPGKVTITAIAENGVSDSISLNVAVPNEVSAVGVCAAAGAAALFANKKRKK